MEKFACLDDSLAYKEGIYIYTHALIVVEELPEVLVIEGNKNSIYQHEKQIKEFIEENLFQDHLLYACNHYMKYCSIWDNLVDFEINKEKKRLPKKIRKTFDEAHQTAKTASTSRLAEILYTN